MNLDTARERYRMTGTREDRASYLRALDRELADALNHDAATGHAPNLSALLSEWNADVERLNGPTWERKRITVERIALAAGWLAFSALTGRYLAVGPVSMAAVYACFAGAFSALLITSRDSFRQLPPV